MSNNVVSIENLAFAYCKHLHQVILSQSITQIAANTFIGCSELSHIELPPNLRKIEYGAFKQIGLVTLTIPNGVTEIGNEAFLSCKNLIQITLPNTLTILQSRIFAYCDHLQSIVLPESVTEIGVGLFEFCFKLRFVTLPQNLTEIPKETFDHCQALSVIPNLPNLQIIGDRAFANSGINAIFLPDSLKKIGDAAFYQCKRLANPQGFVIIKNILFDYFGNDNDIIIPNDVTIIGEQAFSNNKDITFVTISEGVTSIKRFAFQSCPNLLCVYLSNSLSKIEDYAFSSCDNLVTVIMKNETINIANDAFQKSDNVKMIALST